MTQNCGFKADWLCWFACQLFQWKTSLFLSLQDWGRAGDVAALGVCWHVPGQEEENFVFQLLSRLLHPELQRIKGHVSGDQPMSRCAVAFLGFPFLDVIRHTHNQNKDTPSLSLLINDVCLRPEIKPEAQHLFLISVLTLLMKPNQEFRGGKS